MANASRFDQLAAEWDNNPRRVEMARAVGKAICRAVPVQSSWHALDYGAGTGLLTLNLQPHVSSMLAMDSSPGMLETLGRKLVASGIRNIKTRQWDLQAQMFPENGFDLAVSSMTFHHVRDVPLVLRRLGTMLKPGGWLSFADLDEEDGSFHGDMPDVFHRGFSRDRVREWLLETGFSHISVEDAYALTKPDAAGQARTYSIFLAIGQML